MIDTLQAKAALVMATEAVIQHWEDMKDPYFSNSWASFTEMAAYYSICRTNVIDAALDSAKYGITFLEFPRRKAKEEQATADAIMNIK